MPGLAMASYGINAIAFFSLTLFLLCQPKVRSYAPGLLVASFLMTAWGLVSALFLLGKINLQWVMISEVCRTIGWCYCLLDILKFYPKTNKTQWFQKSFIKVMLGLIGLILIECSMWLPPPHQTYLLQTIIKAMFVTHMLLAVFGFSLVEQLFRHVKPQRRWGFKFLSLGLGSMFCYDFYMFTNAILFTNIDATLWEVRGAVNALIAPLVAISVVRNRNWHIDIFPSRQAVFHSTVIVSCGIYLLTMAGLGYYIRVYGGTLGRALEVIFFVGGMLLLAGLLFSGKMRAWFKVILGKYVFQYQYDYRQEWLKFSKLLSINAGEEGLRQRLIIALANIIESTSGVLFEKNEENQYSVTKTWNDSCPTLLLSEDALNDQIGHHAVLFENLNLACQIKSLKNPWLVVPLIYEEQRLAFVVLSRPRVKVGLNWEVLDLLNMAGLQAAVSLRQAQASEKLLIANQFEGLNRISAFVMHDLKNVLSQINLIQTNYKTHHENPEFIRSAFANMNHISQNLEKLLNQLRSRQIQPHIERISLSKVLESVMQHCIARKPIPTLKIRQDAWIFANHSSLSACLTHLVENAQEATAPEGEVKIEIWHEDKLAKISIRDNGSGMSPEFIREHLFKPFVTTKGSNGMGVGVFQAREMIKTFHGQLFVESDEGKGTTFFIHFPSETIVTNETEYHLNESVGEERESKESLTCC